MSEAASGSILVMSDAIFGQAVDAVTDNGDTDPEFDDKSIHCIDCAQDFIWTTGEQIFFRDKKLQNPPKRCKSCKTLKNQRLAAVEAAQTAGIRNRIEIAAECARCSVVTTVPFYPSQGRPVYCRACYLKINAAASNGDS